MHPSISWSQNNQHHCYLHRSLLRWLTTGTHLPEYQLNRLQLIQNSLARAVVRAPKSSHITPSLRSLHWLKIKEWIDLLSLTYKVLTTTKPSYLHDHFSLQPLRSTRSSDAVTLARPPSYSSLNNRSFRHVSPRLWNELPKELCQPVTDESHCHFISPVHHHRHHHHFHYASRHLCSTPDSKLTFSKNPSLHSLPHLFGWLSWIIMTISGLNCSSVFLLFCSFHLFCLIHVID